ncbi:MAG: hypothetical protein IT425_01670 [Pirellulales bacterium]|nr:hypothetical protein [Pirellulales bacterium]
MNVWLGWVWITVGLISGAVVGLFFHDPNWLGGYGAWRRRLVRLGHISFLGTGLLNLAFAFTFANQTGPAPPVLASWLLAVGAVTMPMVCFLTAWRDGLRHLFPIPVASLIGAALSVIVQGLL